MRTQQTRHRFWTVAYRYRNHPLVHTSSPLTATETAARHYAAVTARAWATDVTITEHVVVKTDRPIRVEDLPGPGQPTPLPPLPATVHEIRRYFRCQGYGPPAMPTGDHVRRFLHWVAEGRERQAAGGRTYRGDIDFPDPAALQLRDIQLVISARRISRGQLPL